MKSLRLDLLASEIDHMCSTSNLHVLRTRTVAVPFCDSLADGAVDNTIA